MMHVDVVLLAAGLVLLGAGSIRADRLLGGLGIVFVLAGLAVEYRRAAR